MDERTLTALRGSIAKWERLAAAHPDVRRDDGINDCPLCALFHPELRATPSRKKCDGCPVRKRTGRGGCQGTPYYGWYTREGGAQAELNFLKSLLPAQGIEAEGGDSVAGSVHESPVPEGHAPAVIREGR